MSIKKKSKSTASEKRQIKYRASNKGLTMVYFGNGKGKTTAALGTILRAVGQGWECEVFQFIKGPWPSSEREAIPKFLSSLVKIKAGGKGFVGIMNDKLPREEHKRLAKILFEEAKQLFQTEEHISRTTPKLVVMDELLDTIELELISENEVINFIKKKPENIHLIITGHKKFPNIFKEVDLVTEMKKIKHPFDKGFLAIKGLDY